jgi:hypothetical protein
MDNVDKSEGSTALDAVEEEKLTAAEQEKAAGAVYKDETWGAGKQQQQGVEVQGLQ